MFLSMGKMLEFSMRLEKCRSRAVRMMGKMIGALPLYYAEHMQKKLLEGKWDPGLRWRKQSARIRKSMNRKKTSVHKKTDVRKNSRGRSVL